MESTLLAPTMANLNFNWRESTCTIMTQTVGVKSKLLYHNSTCILYTKDLFLFSREKNALFLTIGANAIHIA